MQRDVAGALTQFRHLRIPFAIVALVALVTLATVTVAAAALGVEIGTLMRDPLAVLEAEPFVGFLSNLGIVLWSASAGVCFLAAFALLRGDSVVMARFFLWSGALTTLLSIDDLYQLHEAVIPYLLGIGQRTIVLGYVVLFGTYLWRFRRVILAAEYPLLVGAGLAFGVSIGVDLIPTRVWSTSLETLLRLAEDGGKFIGIVFWLAFFLIFGARVLTPMSGPASADAAFIPERGNTVDPA